MRDNKTGLLDTFVRTGGAIESYIIITFLALHVSLQYSISIMTLVIPLAIFTLIKLGIILGIMRQLKKENRYTKDNLSNRVDELNGIGNVNILYAIVISLSIVTIFTKNVYVLPGMVVIGLIAVTVTDKYDLNMPMNNKKGTVFGYVGLSMFLLSVLNGTLIDRDLLLLCSAVLIFMDLNYNGLNAYNRKYTYLENFYRVEDIVGVGVAYIVLMTLDAIKTPILDNVFIVLLFIITLFYVILPFILKEGEKHE